MKGDPRLVAIRLACVVAAALVAGSAITARAQDLDEPEEEAPAVNAFDLHESNFDRWVFGNNNSPVSARDRLDALLTINLAEVDRACRLSEAQKAKLVLAGRGDMKRFLDRVEDARKVFDRLRHDQNGINEIFQHTQPLAARLNAGLFGEGSVFAKTLATTLDPTQRAAYDDSLRDKNRFRYEAKVRLAVSTLDGAVGFTAQQRRDFLALILSETSPPRVLGGPYESQVVLLKIAKLPEEKVRPLMDEDRWRVLGRRLDAARRSEAMLRQNGAYEDDPPARRDKTKGD